MPDAPATVGEATAAWWAAQASGGIPLHDSGAEGDQWIVGAYLTALLASKHPAGEDAIAKFRELMAKKVNEFMERWKDSHPTMSYTLGVDYGPDWELAKIADAAGVHGSRFPIKTTTWSYPDRLLVSLGYHGRMTLAWAVEGYERPLCHDQRYEPVPGREGRFLPERCTLPRWHAEEHGAWEPKPLCSICNNPERWSSHEQDYIAMGRGHQFTVSADA